MIGKRLKHYQVEELLGKGLESARHGEKSPQRGRLVVTVEFDGAPERGERGVSASFHRVGDPQVVLDLRCLGHPSGGALQLDDRLLGITPVECTRSTLIQARSAKARASQRENQREKRTSDWEPGRAKSKPHLPGLTA